MTIAQQCGEVSFLPADIVWLRDYKHAMRTAVNFMIAQLRDDQNLVDVAGEVVCCLDGKFVTVKEIEVQFGAHGWNQMIYEAWAWERRNQIMTVSQRLFAHERVPLLLYAESMDSLDISGAECSAAINDACEELYGDDLDDDDCDDCDDCDGGEEVVDDGTYA